MHPWRSAPEPAPCPAARDCICGPARAWQFASPVLRQRCTHARPPCAFPAARCPRTRYRTRRYSGDRNSARPVGRRCYGTRCVLLTRYRILGRCRRVLSVLEQHRRHTAERLAAARAADPSTPARGSAAEPRAGGGGDPHPLPQACTPPSRPRPHPAPSRPSPPSPRPVTCGLISHPASSGEHARSLRRRRRPCGLRRRPGDLACLVGDPSALRSYVHILPCPPFPTVGGVPWQQAWRSGGGPLPSPGAPRLVPGAQAHPADSRPRAGPFPAGPYHRGPFFPGPAATGKGGPPETETGRRPVFGAGRRVPWGAPPAGAGPGRRRRGRSKSGGGPFPEGFPPPPRQAHSFP